MNTMIRMETESPFRAARTARAAPVSVFQNFVTACPRTLGQAIQAAVDAIADGALKPRAPDEAAPFAQTRALLALLADCYARQIYNSTEAARLAASDPDFPWPWWETLPDAGVLRRCRGENRAAIHRCLVAALHFLLEQKISAGTLTKLNDPQLAKEASRRIIMAAFADSMELDRECADAPPAEISYLFANGQARGH